jgi:transketolase
LNRRELLEILVAQSQENDELRQLAEQLVEEKRELNEKLRDRKIKIEKAGTLAEATFMINGVLESAQVAAQQYLDNLQDLYDREEINCTEKEKATESRCAAMTVVAQERCDIMKRDTEAQCKAMEEETQKKCEDMMRDTEAKCAHLTQKARDEAEAHWQQLTEKLESFYSAHAGLKEILSATDHRLRNEE